MRNSLINHEPLIHISRRSDISTKTAILIKVATVLIAFLLCGLISNAFAPGSFFEYYYYIFEGTLYSFNTILSTLWNAAILLLLAVAITPSFKMKFWNIGAEGQALMGAFGAAVIMKFVAPNLPNAIAILIMLVTAVAFGAIWAFIPAVFKSYFNTNETLFTLMMNYIAIGIVAAFSLKFKGKNDTALGVLNADTHAGWLPEPFGYHYIIGIIVIILLVVGVAIFLKYSKHGYEINVLNGSVRTAEYVGINVKWVTMRTLIMAGALCGIGGFLIVSGASHTVSETTIGGRGFTAVMVSWLGHFNPFEMVVYAVLNSLVSTGSSNAAGNLGYSGEVASVLSGLFFLLILISEFFANFTVRFNFKRKTNDTDDGDNEQTLEEAKQ